MKNFRDDFPNLHITINGHPLIYADNAATAMKPKVVIDAVTRYYNQETSNVHRGLHKLSQEATEKFEKTREEIAAFINANSANEIVFTKGTTESINLVAKTYPFKKGDVVLISEMEHHANIVPWQLLQEEKEILIKTIPLNDKGEILLAEYESLLKDATLVCITHISNAIGTINPVKKMIALAHQQGALVLIDAAQSIPHTKIDVEELDADFLAFSGHKLYGPTGIGILYGKETLLKKMAPYQGGGDMIESVTVEKTTFKEPPYKFEAGTPNIAGVFGLKEAIAYLKNIGYDAIAKKETELLKYATEKLQEIKGLTIIGTAKEKGPIISFTLDNVHPHDVAELLNKEGIAVRAGHHCCQPLMQRFNIPATTRISLSFYNEEKEIDAMSDVLKKIKEKFR